LPGSEADCAPRDRHYPARPAGAGATSRTDPPVRRRLPGPTRRDGATTRLDPPKSCRRFSGSGRVVRKRRRVGQGSRVAAGGSRRVVGLWPAGRTGKSQAGRLHRDPPLDRQRHATPRLDPPDRGTTRLHPPAPATSRTDPPVRCRLPGPTRRFAVDFPDRPAGVGPLPGSTRRNHAGDFGTGRRGLAPGLSRVVPVGPVAVGDGCRGWRSADWWRWAGTAGVRVT
jgi:hypothetical protein